MSDIENLDELYARTFSTESGKIVLSHFRETTIERPCFIAGEDPSFGFVREGENEFVRGVERRIKRHRSRK